MDPDILFEEEQQFSRKSAKGAVTVIGVLLLGGVLIAFVSGKAIGQTAISSFALVFLALAVLSYILDKSKLSLQIREDGIYVRLSPFHRKFQVYSWEVIDLAYVRNYDGLREFGGWGLKMGASGTSYTTSGDIGLQLVLSNNNRLLIGTQQAGRLADILHRLGKLDFPPDSIFRP